MSAPQFLPWQLETARNWLGNRERFAHAWLVHGLAGIGKLDFAVAAAASLLCETPQDGLACGHCAACAWFASGNHPDLRRIRPEAIAVEEGAEAAEQAEDAEPVAGSASSARRPRNPHRPDPRVGILVQHRHPPGRLARGATVSGPCAERGLGQRAAQGAGRAAAPHGVLAGGGCARPAAADPGVALPPPAPAPDADTALQWLREQNVEPAREWLAAGGGAPLAALRLAQSGEAACPHGWASWSRRWRRASRPMWARWPRRWKRCRRPTGSTRCNASIPT